MRTRRGIAVRSHVRSNQWQRQPAALRSQGYDELKSRLMSERVIQPEHGIVLRALEFHFMIMCRRRTGVSSRMLMDDRMIPPPFVCVGGRKRLTQQHR